MIEENNDLLNKVKYSFEEILKFSKFFEFERYKYCKFGVLCYKNNNNWIIEYMRIYFTFKPIKHIKKQVSKEENALYVQFSHPIENLLKIFDVDKNGVFLTIDNYQIYFDNKFESISYDKIINKLKNQYPYQFKESKTKLNFYCMHDLYSGYNLQQYKYQRENFGDTKTEMIHTGEDVFNDLMKMSYGLFGNCFILFVFPIYSFSFNYEILEENEEKIILFESKMHNRLKDSIEIFYQIQDEKKQNLKENIKISKEFYGIITILIIWYGDESFLPKGTLLYKEKIPIERIQKVGEEKIQENKKMFIETDFFQYQLPDYDEIKNLINICAYHPEFYKLLPNLIRNLFENLLRDVFSACLATKYTTLFISKDQGRVKNLSKLIDLLNILKSEFESLYGTKIPDEIFNNLIIFKKKANHNVHEIQTVIEPNYAEKNKHKHNITLNILLQLYRRINTARKKIENIEPNLLKKIEDKKISRGLKAKLEENQIDEISQLISSIRFDLDNQVTKNLFGRRISTSGRNTIQKKIDELSSEVIQLKLKNSAYDSLVISIDSLDREFNIEFIHRETLLDKINDVSTYFKYAISDIYSKEKK